MYKLRKKFGKKSKTPLLSVPLFAECFHHLVKTEIDLNVIKKKSFGKTVLIKSV